MRNGNLKRKLEPVECESDRYDFISRSEGHNKNTRYSVKMDDSEERNDNGRFVVKKVLR